MACFVGCMHGVFGGGGTDRLTSKSGEHITQVPSLTRTCKEAAGPFGKGGVVSGSVEPGWERVRAEFEANFAQNLELGAQLVIYKGEEKVVDLHGYSSKQLGYTADTVQCVYSSGKNVEVIAIAVLVDRGLLKYSDLVGAHWPEFAKHGKEKITIADVMRHEAGLPIFVDSADPDNKKKDKQITPEVAQDIQALCKFLEEQPCYQPGGERAYHAVTRGFIVSGIVHKVDPKKRTLGQFWKEEVTDKLGCSYFVGIPESEQDKISRADMTQMPKCFNCWFELIPALCGCGDPTLTATMKAFSKNKKNPMLRQATTWQKKMPRYNSTKEGMALEVSSAGAYTNARGIAMTHAVLANGGKLGSVRIMSERACEMVIAEPKLAYDNCIMSSWDNTQGGVIHFNSNMQGAMITDKEGELFKNFYGWGGWGGSVSVFDPGRHVSVGYAMNGMSNYLFGGPRMTKLFTEIQAAIDSK